MIKNWWHGGKNVPSNKDSFDTDNDKNDNREKEAFDEYESTDLNLYCAKASGESIREAVWDVGGTLFIRISFL